MRQLTLKHRWKNNAPSVYMCLRLLKYMLNCNLCSDLPCTSEYSQCTEIPGDAEQENMKKTRRMQTKDKFIR